MLLAFTLTMPNRGSWNGGWSGEDRLFVKIEKFNGKKGAARAATILSGRPYSYNWGDGWRASIDVREVTPAEARVLRKRSAGFCGYDWMIETIRLYGRPMADHELKAHLAAERAKEAEAFAGAGI